MIDMMSYELETSWVQNGGIFMAQFWRLALGLREAGGKHQPLGKRMVFNPHFRKQKSRMKIVNL